MESQLTTLIRSASPDILVRDSADLAGRDTGSHPENFSAGLMAVPGSVQDIATLVAACAAKGIPVVTQGGRTGLVDGTVSAPGELIISTERLAAIEEIDDVTGVAVVQAGVTLEALQKAAAVYGLQPGIDLGARGTATIGGMVSTNAGGIQAFRHGVMRHRVLGLEVVLTDGTVFSDLTRVVKSTTGYDIKQLFIGAEGTLGIVTRAVIKLETLPIARATALVAVGSAQDALMVGHHFSRMPGAPLLACEIMSQDFLLMNANAQNVSLPDGFSTAPMSVLIEIEGPTSGDAEHTLSEGLTAVWERAGVVDGIIAQSLSQRDELWHLREDMSVFSRLYPSKMSFDVSVPSSRADDYIATVQNALLEIAPTLGALIFGHIADGNLHVIPKIGKCSQQLAAQIESACLTGLESHGGAMSAEHGIGTKKLEAFHRFVSLEKQDLVASVKNALDPQGLFNPGKILRKNEL